MKRHFELADEYENFGEFLEAVVVANSDGSDVRKHFLHAGIGMEDQ
jgi:hypothetical protein